MSAPIATTPREAPLIRRTPPVHWPTLISELQQHVGLSLRQIGDALGVAHTTVNTWLRPTMRRGEVREPGRPSYEDGKALLELHAMFSAQITAAKRNAPRAVRNGEPQKRVAD